MDYAYKYSCPGTYQPSCGYQFNTANWGQVSATHMSYPSYYQQTEKGHFNSQGCSPNILSQNNGVFQTFSSQRVIDNSLANRRVNTTGKYLPYNQIFEYLR